MNRQMLFAVAVAFVFATGCNSIQPQKSDSERTQPVSSSKPQPGHAAAKKHGHTPTSKLTPEQREKPVATLGGRSITLGEFESRLNEQPSYVRVRYSSLERKKEFLNNMVQFELLAMEAKRKGYATDPDVVFAMKQEMVKKVLAEDLDALVKMSDITDADVEAFYKENQALYHKPAQVRVNEIVFVEQAKADRIAAEIKAKFVDEPRRKRQIFNQQVRKHSVSSETQARNGDLNFFAKDGKLSDGKTKLPVAVVDAAFGLEKINDLSVPVFDGKHWRVLLLTNRRPQVDKALGEVQRQIKNKLFRQRKEEARANFLSDLREQAKVVIDEEQLALVGNPELKFPEANKRIPGLKEVDRMVDQVKEKGMLPIKEGE